MQRNGWPQGAIFAIIAFGLVVAACNGSPSQSSQGTTSTGGQATPTATASPTPLPLPSTVYFTTNGGNLDALSGANGALLWNRAFKSSAGDGYFDSSITLANGLIYHLFGNDHTYSAINARTGATVWSFDRGAASDLYAIEGVLADGLIFITKGTCVQPRCSFAQDILYALDPLTGGVRWHQNGVGLIATDATRLYVRDDSKIQALAPQTGTVQWTFTEPEIIQNFQVNNGTLYLIDSKDAYHPGVLRVVGVDASTGQQKWTYAKGSAYLGLDDTLSDGVIVYVQVGSVSSAIILNANDGSVRWSFTQGRIDLFGGHIFFRPYPDGLSLQELDSATGAVQWTYRTGSGTEIFGPQSGMLYIATQNGTNTTLAQVAVAGTKPRWTITIPGLLWPIGFLRSIGENSSYLSFGTIGHLQNTMAGGIVQAPYFTFLVRQSDGTIVWKHQTGDAIAAIPILTP